jgi:hypothetical protein
MDIFISSRDFVVENRKYAVRIEVSMAVSKKIIIVWDVTPCSLVIKYQATWRHTPENVVA